MSTPPLPEPLASLQQTLLDRVTHARYTEGISQAALAKRTGMGRMTVHRNEQPGADPLLSNFLTMASALNLAVELRDKGRPDGPPAAKDLVHRGYAFNRTQYNLEDRDRQREAALAKSWMTVNQHQDFGLSAILPALVPNCSQEQASACATVVQWMGSEVGLDFLRNALAHAGYTVVDTKKDSKDPRA